MERPQRDPEPPINPRRTPGTSTLPTCPGALGSNSFGEICHIPRTQSCFAELWSGSGSGVDLARVENQTAGKSNPLVHKPRHYPLRKFSRSFRTCGRTTPKGGDLRGLKFPNRKHRKVPPARARPGRSIRSLAGAQEAPIGADGLCSRSTKCLTTLAKCPQGRHVGRRPQDPVDSYRVLSLDSVGFLEVARRSSQEHYFLSGSGTTQGNFLANQGNSPNMIGPIEEKPGQPRNPHPVRTTSPMASKQSEPP